MTITVGLIQLNSGDDPAINLPITVALIKEAAEAGATFVLTPEVTNIVSTNRAHQQKMLQTERDDITLKALCALAEKHEIWLLIGSLALKPSAAAKRFVNRSFLISPQGVPAASYDKIHMFDVSVSPMETYRESTGYRPGDRSVLVHTDFAAIGMTICYDIRFPTLYRQLARLGAQILTVPSAFSPATGAGHWQSLLRARAIENGAFVLAPAQTGKHTELAGAGRETFGHSLVVDPWGNVLLDAGTQTGAFLVNLDLKMVGQSRAQIPALKHDRAYRMLTNDR